MKLAKEQRTALEDYFKSLGLNRNDRATLFRYIRSGGSWEHPLIIEGEPTTGKSTLTHILRKLGVCACTRHEADVITLKKRIEFSETSGQCVRDIFELLDTEGE